MPGVVVTFRFRKKIAIGFLSSGAFAATGAAFYYLPLPGKPKTQKSRDLVGTPTFDDHYQLAIRAFSSGDSRQALDWLRQAAKAGSVQAQTMLGKVYIEGKLVEPDPAEGLRWLRLAASKGHLPALQELAEVFRHGKGVQVNLEEAETFFRLAAGSGDAEARLALAGLYLERAQTDKRWADKGESLLKDLAESGQAEAMVRLGHIAKERQDYREGCSWYAKAAAKGSSDGAIGIARCFRLGEGREPNKVEFLRWMMTAAEADNPVAQHELGTAYLYGLSTSQDPKEAVVWFEKAAHLGHASSQYTLGILYAVGIGTSRNPETATYWLNEASRQGESRAASFAKKVQDTTYLDQLEIDDLPIGPASAVTHH